MIVYVTCGSDTEASAISELLVRQHLAACVSIAGVESIFQWQGKFERQAEKLLIIKTVQSRFEEIERLVKNNHSYNCPEIVAVEIAAVSKDYENWLRSACKAG